MNLPDSYFKEIEPLVKEFERMASQIDTNEKFKSDIIPLSKNIVNVFNEYYGGGHLADALSKYYEIAGENPPTVAIKVAEVVEKNYIINSSEPSESSTEQNKEDYYVPYDWNSQKEERQNEEQAVPPPQEPTRQEEIPYQTGIPIISASATQIDLAYINEVQGSIHDFEQMASKVNVVDTAKSQLIPLGEKIQDVYVKYYGKGDFHDALSKYYEVMQASPSYQVSAVGKIVNNALKVGNSISKLELLNAGLKALANQQATKSEERKVEETGSAMASLVNEGEQESKGFVERSGILAGETVVRGIDRLTKIKKVNPDKVPTTFSAEDLKRFGIINVPVEDIRVVESLSKTAKENYMSDMLPLYKKYVASVFISDSTKYSKNIIDKELADAILTVDKKYFGKEVAKDVQSAINRFEYFLSQENPDLLQSIQTKGVGASLQSIQTEEAGFGIQDVSQNIIDSLSLVSEKAYVSDMLPLYEKYLTAVSVSDVMAKYGKEAKIDDKLISDIITVYKKHFGAETKDSVTTIISKFEGTLKKSSPDLLQKIRQNADAEAEKVKSNIIAGVKQVDISKLNVTVKEVQNTGRVIQTGAKASIIPAQLKHTVGVISRDAIIASSIVGGAKSKIDIRQRNLQESNVTVAMDEWKQRLAQRPFEIRNAVRFTKGAVQATKTIGKAIAKMVIAIAKGLMTVAAQVLTVTMPLILIVMIVLIILITVFPSVIYGGLTHLSTDVAINETYSYVTLKTASILSGGNGTGYYDYAYNMGVSIPEGLITDPTIEEAKTGYIYAGYNPSDLTYLLKTDPMAYISLLSAYYTEFSFPEFYYTNPSTGENEVKNVMEGAGLMSFDNLFAIDYKPLVGEEQKPDNFDVAVNQMTVVEEKAEFLKFLYEKWWWPARAQKVKEETLSAAQKEAQIRLQLGLDIENAKKIIEDYAKLLDSEEFLKYFGEEQKANFSSIVLEEKEKFDEEIKNINGLLDDYLELIDSLKKIAADVYAVVYGTYDVKTHMFQPTDPSGNPSGTPYEVCDGCTFEDDTAYGNQLAEMAFGPYENAVKNFKNELSTYQKTLDGKYDELANGFMTTDGPSVPDWWPDEWKDIGASETTWYSPEEIAREQRITDEMEATFNLIINGLNVMKSYIPSFIAILNAYLGYEAPKPPASVCDCGSEYSTAQSHLSSAQSRARSARGSVKAFEDRFNNEIKRFKETFMKKAVTCYVTISVSTPYTELTDADLADVSSELERETYKTLYKGNNLAIYIMKNVLSIDKTENNREIRDARASFIQIYNPYGMLLKQELSPGQMDMTDMVYEHHLGFFYDPVAKALAFDKLGRNPQNEPGIYSTTLVGTSIADNDIVDNVDETLFFTTASYVRRIIGIPITRPGFLDREENWINNTILYKGSVLTSSYNDKKVSDYPVEASDYTPFTVYSPIAGELRKTSDNALVITKEYTASSVVGGDETSERILTTAITLRGVTLSDSITLNPSSAVGEGEAIGTANFLYVDYAAQEDEYYVLLGGHWRIPRDLNFYREPSLYFMITEDQLTPGTPSGPSGGS